MDEKIKELEVLVGQVKFTGLDDTLQKYYPEGYVLDREEVPEVFEHLSKGPVSLYDPEVDDKPDDNSVFKVVKKYENIDKNKSKEDTSDDGSLLEDKLGSALVEKLVEAGYDSVTKVRDATDEELLAIEGVGDSSLEKLREATAK